jgi:hypothetical protein
MERKHEKLLSRLFSKPKDFRWGKLTTLLNSLGYKKLECDGSRVKFYRASPRSLISIHKPHPEEILKSYQVKEIIQKLEGDSDGNN